MADVLASSTARETRGALTVRGVTYVPVFCANCSHEAERWIPEATKTFAFYLCEPCAEKWSPMVDLALIPDEVFWQSVNDAMLEEDGRILTAAEQVAALGDVNHYLSKIARSRQGA